REARRSRLYPCSRPGRRARDGARVSVRPGDDPGAGDRVCPTPRTAASDTEWAHSGVRSAASVESLERLRLFCALCLPEEVRDRLAERQQLHLTGAHEAHLVPSEHLHITLAFLSSTATLHVADVVAAL